MDNQQTSETTTTKSETTAPQSEHVTIKGVAPKIVDAAAVSATAYRKARDEGANEILSLAEVRKIGLADGKRQARKALRALADLADKSS